MPGIKISDLTPVTPLKTDLLPLDRPTTGPGAPVTGKASLSEVRNFIMGGGVKYWLESTDDFTVRDRCQYIVQSGITIDLGGSLNLEPLAQLVILP